MRLFGLWLLVALALLGPLPATTAAASSGPTEVTAPADDSPEFRSPAEPMAEPPMRSIRLEPPERALTETLAAPTRSAAPKPNCAARTVRLATERPWAPKAALHLELCLFLC